MLQVWINIICACPMITVGLGSAGTRPPDPWSAGTRPPDSWSPGTRPPDSWSAETRPPDSWSAATKRVNHDELLRPNCGAFTPFHSMDDKTMTWRRATINCIFLSNVFVFNFRTDPSQFCQHVWPPSSWFLFDPYVLCHWSLREKVVFSPNGVNLIKALITAFEDSADVTPRIEI